MNKGRNNQFKINYPKQLLIVLLMAVFVGFGCKKDKNELTVDISEIEVPAIGGSFSFVLSTNAGSWSISNSAPDWITLSGTSGTYPTATISVNVTTKTLTTRNATITVMADNADPVSINVTQIASQFLYSITPDVDSLKFKKSGNTLQLSIQSDAHRWKMTKSDNWLTCSVDSGKTGTTTINITTIANPNTAPRRTILEFTAQYADTVRFAIYQNGDLYPSFNTNPLGPDTTGMNLTAVQLAARIKLGWNIGNSLEVPGGETAWGNPEVSKALIDLVKQNGFNAIRIPCSFNQYITNGSTAQLSSTWLNRVKDVIQYCTDKNMYVLLNIHWDGGWLENNCNTDAQEEVNAKQKAFWEQIATTLRDFDHHLMFASANEPAVSNATNMAVLLSYHQTFVDAVRSTGGKNYYRTLVVQGPSTDIETTNNLMNKLPTDVVSNHMMVEIHYYTPWNFCGMTSDQAYGKMFYYWGNGYHSTTDITRNATWGEESTVLQLFGYMKTKFVNKGIPVIMGEYAVTRRSSLTGDNLTLHLNSRAYYYRYVTQKARINGILPFYWDNGYTGNNGCAIFNRNNNTVFDKQALDSLISGAQ